MTCSFDRRGRSRRAAPPLRASIWAVTVTGDQPPPTRCPAPSQSSPSELFWLALSPVPEGPARKVRSRNARSATSMWCWEPRGPAFKPVTGAAVCAWRGVWPRGCRRSAGDARLNGRMNRFAHLALAGRYGRDFALGAPQARYGFAIAVLSVLRILKGSRNRGELDRPLDQEDSTVTVANRLVCGGRTAARVRTELRPKHRKPARGVNPGG